MDLTLFQDCQFVTDRGGVVNRLPIYKTEDGQREDMPPFMYCAGVPKYWLNGAGERGALRRAAADLVLDLLGREKQTRAWVYYHVIGGAKGSGDTGGLPLKQLAYVRQSNPLISLFGSGDPMFLAGSLKCGHLFSVDPIDMTKLARRSIIRRDPINDGTISLDDLSDPEIAIAANLLNTKRARLTKYIESVEGQPRGRSEEVKAEDSLPPGEPQGRLMAALAGASSDFQAELRTMKDLKDLLAQTKAEIKALGIGDVSAQTALPSRPMVPPGTVFEQHISVVNGLPMSIGLLIAAMDRAAKFQFFIGGRSASGDGGMLTRHYQVQWRAENDWVDDCQITLTPKVGVTFDNQPSRLRACWEAWQAAEPEMFDFSVPEMQKMDRIPGNRVVRGRPARGRPARSGEA